MLQAHEIRVVIPEKSDAIARRQAKGSAGGRLLDFDAKDYKKRALRASMWVDSGPDGHGLPCWAGDQGGVLRVG